MKRVSKYSKSGLLLNVIRAGAFYLFRYIKHAIKNEIVFVWTTIRHVWIPFISADVNEKRIIKSYLDADHEEILFLTESSNVDTIIYRGKV